MKRIKQVNKDVVKYWLWRAIPASIFIVALLLFTKTTHRSMSKPYCYYSSPLGYVFVRDGDRHTYYRKQIKSVVRIGDATTVSFIDGTVITLKTGKVCDSKEIFER